MFASFDSVNTPGVKVWDFSKPVASGKPEISIEDDCAPYQFVLTGGTTTSIRIVLPYASTSGKVIRTPVGSISLVGRNTMGVRLINLEEGEKVAAVAKIAEGSSEEEDAQGSRRQAAEVQG